MSTPSFVIAFFGGMWVAILAPIASEWFGYHGASLGLPWWFSVIGPLALTFLAVTLIEWAARKLSPASNPPHIPN